MVKLDKLLKNIADEDSTTRIKAIKKLANIQSDESRGILINTLNDISTEVRYEALIALENFKEWDDINPFINILKNDSSEKNRAYVAKMLGKTRKKEAIDHLIEGLKELSSEVREWSVWALGNLEDKRAIEPIIKILNDEDWRVRSWAVEALGKIKDPQVINYIIKSLKDEVEEVQLNSVIALGELKANIAIPHLINLITSSKANVVRETKRILGIIDEKYKSKSVEEIMEIYENSKMESVIPSFDLKNRISGMILSHKELDLNMIVQFINGVSIPQIKSIIYDLVAEKKILGTFEGDVFKVASDMDVDLFANVLDEKFSSWMKIQKDKIPSINVLKCPMCSAPLDKKIEQNKITECSHCGHKLII